MTAEQLIIQMNIDYGLNQWPKTLEVDAETYGNCCQYIFDYLITHGEYYRYLDLHFMPNLNLGPNKGLMFKNVELILKT